MMPFFGITGIVAARPDSPGFHAGLPSESTVLPSLSFSRAEFAPAPVDFDSSMLVGFFLPSSRGPIPETRCTMSAAAEIVLAMSLADCLTSSKKSLSFCCPSGDPRN
ncbi:Uncharacterised protein [Mycobacteroides abscessus subsp. abscessus]|nr:Uncharacterised protein [Mycobacteroides abscessus subsp. abscessus]